MQKLTVDLLNELKLDHLDSVEAVRRQGNAYALNGEGKLLAVSMTGKDIPELNLGEECKDLEYLYLAYNQYLSEIRFDVETPKLHSLYLNNCALLMLHLPNNLKALKQLYVQKNQLFEMSFGGDCPALELLDASENKLQMFELLADFPKLAYLYLHKNQIEDLLFTKSLPSLNILDLRENKLDELPLVLVQCTYLEALYINNNPLGRFKRDVLNDEGDQNSWEGIRNYLSSLIVDEVQEYDQVKLIVLGNSTAGKTSLVHFLKDRTYLKSRDSTHGMVPIIWNLDATCKVAVWDFGGQEYYHNIHHLFFTDQCLYLVVFEQKANENGNLPTEIKIFGQNEPIIENLEHFHYSYWLDNIRYLTQKQGEDKNLLEVVKVQNKFDLPPEQKIEGADYHISVEKAFEAFQKPKKEEDRYWSGFQHFENELKATLKKIRGEVPVSTKWLEIKNEIQNKAMTGVPYLTRTDYTNLAEKIKSGISNKGGGQEQSELDTLIETFTKSGVALYYPEIDPNRIYINPAWLADAIYRVLNHQVKEEFGKFSLKQAQQAITAWQAESPFSSTITINEEELIAIMSELDLIYELDPALNPEDCKDGSRVFIAPQYLPLECPEPRNVKRIQNPPASPFFTLRYPIFLPKSTMPRFIARHGQWAMHPCWRYGIVYEKKGMEVLVECLFEQKLIQFWIKPDQRKPDLIREIFDQFDQINDKNPEIQLSLNQKDFVRIGTLLRHPFGENRKIESVDGIQLDALAFAEFLVLGTPDQKDIRSTHKTNLKMHGIDKEIQGLAMVLDELIDKKTDFQMALIRAYDEEKKRGLRKDIEDLEEKIKAHRQKIVELENMVGVAETSTQSSHLQELLVKTDQLKEDLGAITKQLDHGFQSILNQLSAQDQQLLAIHQTTEAHQTTLAQYFVDLDQKPVNEYETQIMLGQISAMIGDHLAELPETITQHWKALNAKAPEYTDVKGKLKLKIPIIPTILEYEKELSWDLRNIAKQIWTDLKAGKVFLK